MVGEGTYICNDCGHEGPEERECPYCGGEMATLEKLGTEEDLPAGRQGCADEDFSKEED